ncbi:MAG: C40 family peptidase [Roseburia sp.]|nr:C40 family peptidase [Roseburia sp.]
MTKKWNTAVCMVMAVVMLLADAPALIYATNNEISTETTEVAASAEVTEEAPKRNLKVLELMETGKQKVNSTVAVLEELKAPYVGVAIAQVDNYVHVRAEANTESEVLGKLYNNSAATVLETTEDGWYKITSGSVTGYVKCEYVVVGDENLAREVSTRYATVTTQTLNVRMEPTTDAKILTMLPEGDDFVVIDESMYMSGWVMVTTSEGEGYVYTDYVELWTEFVTAESKEEEAARLKKEEEARRKAAAAAEAARRKKEKEAAEANKSDNYTAPANSNGQAVADYACQFVGNPYVYGGTSLTNGADCSGFVMSVYAAFGVSLPHSSKSMRSVGYEVSTSEMQPGDIICYSGHVAIYIGNDTIVHASNAREGIKYTSPAAYKSIICVRRIF